DAADLAAGAARGGEEGVGGPHRRIDEREAVVLADEERVHEVGACQLCDVRREGGASIRVAYHKSCESTAWERASSDRGVPASGRLGRGPSSLDSSRARPSPGKETSSCAGMMRLSSPAFRARRTRLDGEAWQPARIASDRSWSFVFGFAFGF